jgi:LDH2 family malate/lactate/ureidoglycolate dehydrogenase
LSKEEFSRRMDEILKMLMASPPVAGVERVLLPGEVERQAEARNGQRGVCLPEEVARELIELGTELGVSFPQEVREAQTV